MWLWMTLGSALMLGIYDVFKKQALKNNSVLWVLLAATALSTLFLSPFLSSGPVEDHLRLVLKAVLVTTSWVSGLIGLKLLPITTVSTLKASRPFFVVLFSIVLFGEQLNGWQWAGVALALLALTLLSGASKKEGIDFSKSKGVAAMAVSILAGVASALYDKKVVASMDPLFLQSWCNFYITVLLALCILVKSLRDKENRERFKWDWMRGDCRVHHGSGYALLLCVKTGRSAAFSDFTDAPLLRSGNFCGGGHRLQGEEPQGQEPGPGYPARWNRLPGTGITVISVVTPALS